MRKTQGGVAATRLLLLVVAPGTEFDDEGGVEDDDERSRLEFAQNDITPRDSNSEARSMCLRSCQLDS